MNKRIAYFISFLVLILPIVFKIDNVCSLDNTIDINKIISGDVKITYEMFGAKGDGKTNDYEAIKKAHDVANQIYIEHDILVTVYATKDKIYYISTMDEPIDVITNVNFNNANFIIDDYVDSNNDSVNDINTVNAIFNITNAMYVDTKNEGNAIRRVSLKTDVPEDFYIDKETTNLQELIDAVKKNWHYRKNEHVSKYLDNSRYWGIVLVNNNIQYIRTGKNASKGSNQTELIVIDSTTGDLLTELIWDYYDLKDILIYPINNQNITIENGNFLTKTNNVVYSSEKINAYSNRNVYINHAGNVTIQNIKHNIDENSHLYTSKYQPINGNLYMGFIYLDNSAYVRLNNIDLTPKTFTNLVLSDGTVTSSGNGTYDLTINNSANVYLDNISYYCDGDEEICYKENMTDDSKWGIMNSNTSKNVFIYNSKLNRIDAHKGITNLYIKDTTIGNKGITIIGQGYLYAENVVFDGPTTMIFLRNDYGSSFNGSMYLKNITYKVGNEKYPNLFYSNNIENHDFGYKSYFPSIYIDGINIDTTKTEDLVYVSLIRLAKDPLSTAQFDNENMLYYFNPEWMVKNLEVTNNESLNLFPADFCNVLSNLTISTYGGNNSVKMDLDSKIHVHSNVKNVLNPKFVVDSSIKMQVSFEEVNNYFNKILTSFSHFDKIEDGMIGVFPSIIANEKDNIISINFIKDDESNFISRYNSSIIKADLGYNCNSKVRGWLEKDELDESKYHFYVASENDIYLYSGEKMFKNFKNLTTINFDNLLFDRVDSTEEMFYGCEKLNNVDFNKFEITNIKNTKEMFFNTLSLIKKVDNVLKIYNKSGFSSEIISLVFSGLVYDKSDLIVSNRIVNTGDYVSSDGKKVYGIAVSGDVDGDGIIDVYDIIALRKHILNIDVIDEKESRYAADVLEDEDLDIYDIISLRKLILEK